MRPTRRSWRSGARRPPSEAGTTLFDLPAGVVYMDGNSLGAAPAAVGAAIEAVLGDWRRVAVRGWNSAGWLDLPTQLGDQVGALIGAAPGQVVVADNTTVNLYKALSAAVALAGGPVAVLDAEFPTDRFIADRFGSKRCASVEDLVGPQAALLSHVDFRTGELRDMAAVSRAVHDAGGAVVWDLSHSAGALPVALDACGADLAVGCGYKFLNGGPGAPAYIYVASRHLERVDNPIPGWFGDADTFAFGPAYRPAPGIRRMLTGTPSVIAMAALRAGLETFAGADLRMLRERSLALGDRVIAALDGLGVEVLTPREPDRRGSHVAARHGEAPAVAAALLESGVVVDTRPPDAVRFGITPLTLDEAGVDLAMERFRTVLEERLYDEPRFRSRDRVP